MFLSTSLGQDVAMISFTEQARIYGEFHQKPETKYMHIASILLLFLAGLIFLGFLHIVMPGVFEITLADVATACLLIYYFFLNWRLAIVLTPVLLILLWISHLISYSGPSSFSVWALIMILILSGLVLGIGYYFEGRRPPLKVGLWQLLIEPMFLTAEIFFMIGKMRSLQNDIYGISPREKNSNESK
jgi:uncharacterized membrane protein YGL010W